MLTGRRLRKSSTVNVVYSDRIINTTGRHLRLQRIATDYREMEGRASMDEIDRIILRKLSLYESLASLELWYEIGEDHVLEEAVTKEEISSRLESLRAQGLVERLTEVKGGIRWALKRGDANPPIKRY